MTDIKKEIKYLGNKKKDIMSFLNNLILIFIIILILCFGTLIYMKKNDSPNNIKTRLYDIVNRIIKETVKPECIK